jgi:hypothetical protein
VSACALTIYVVQRSLKTVRLQLWNPSDSVDPTRATKMCSIRGRKRCGFQAEFGSWVATERCNTLRTQTTLYEHAAQRNPRLRQIPPRHTSVLPISRRPESIHTTVLISATTHTRTKSTDTARPRPLSTTTEFSTKNLDHMLHTPLTIYSLERRSQVRTKPQKQEA